MYIPQTRLHGNGMAESKGDSNHTSSRTLFEIRLELSTLHCFGTVLELWIPRCFYNEYATDTIENTELHQLLVAPWLFQVNPSTTPRYVFERNWGLDRFYVTKLPQVECLVVIPQPCRRLCQTRPSEKSPLHTHIHSVWIVLWPHKNGMSVSARVCM